MENNEATRNTVAKAWKVNFTLKYRDFVKDTDYVAK